MLGPRRHPACGIATSFFADRGFDSRLTLEFAAGRGIRWVQLYLSEELERSPHRIDELRSLSAGLGLSILCHSPRDLDASFASDGHLEALSRFFPDALRRLVVTHFDERVPVSDMLETARLCTRSGLVLCVENYYRSKTPEEFILNIERYAALFAHAREEGLPLIPVLDPPRLFIDRLSRFADPLAVCERLLESISPGGSPRSGGELILHLIDFSSPLQRRGDWVPLGSGLMPWSEIFRSIRMHGFSIPAAVLEYEDFAAGDASIEMLDSLLS